MSTTHFGFKQVDESQKAQHVRGVFDSVANKYDVMNDLMSMGLHRLWKAYAIAASGVREGHKVLDIAGGTGDLSEAFAARVGPTGMVVHTDSPRVRTSRKVVLELLASPSKKARAYAIEYARGHAKDMPLERTVALLASDHAEICKFAASQLTTRSPRDLGTHQSLDQHAPKTAPGRWATSAKPSGGLELFRVRVRRFQLVGRGQHRQRARKARCVVSARQLADHRKAQPGGVK